ncbi:uncharacterized protein MONBRDRAFT_27199 [Monosiga brevicollis MX1]|uniref:Uncharacterized protein n=1 Tax=Monosiga brevicollis TaxID=81824 RepID=A9V4L2_MONBE|nr:uncharacterized protein MONBRDRAFT_27199 [Monosiga brevicollis MX1]EDQ87474.1 predicted protein [Monosiga brevicollis MX1]|eukprot:XP_001747734.1 hypothetical protein [Monosiga brevicollis MX1]
MAHARTRRYQRTGETCNSPESRGNSGCKFDGATRGEKNRIDGGGDAEETERRLGWRRPPVRSANLLSPLHVHLQNDTETDPAQNFYRRRHPGGGGGGGEEEEEEEEEKKRR